MESVFVKNYFESIWPVKEYNKMAGLLLVEKFGEKKAAEVASVIVRREQSTGKKSSVENEKEIYNLKNETPELSLAITYEFEHEATVNCCQWFDAHPELFHGKILEAGCDNGIISCFLAERFPEAEIYGVDRCAAGIRCAEQLAAQRGLSNVHFSVRDIRDLGEERFDVVISGRTLMENFPQFSKSLMMEPLEEASAFCQSRIAGYTEALVRLVGEGGIFIALERMGKNPMLLAWMREICSHGLGILPGTLTALPTGVIIDKISAQNEAEYLLPEQPEDQIPELPDDNETDITPWLMVREKQAALRHPEKHPEKAAQFPLDIVFAASRSLSNSTADVDAQYADYILQPVGRENFPLYGYQAGAALHVLKKDLLVGYNVYDAPRHLSGRISVWTNRENEESILTEFIPSQLNPGQIREVTNLYAVYKEDILAEMNKTAQEWAKDGLKVQEFGIGDGKEYVIRTLKGRKK